MQPVAWRAMALCAVTVLLGAGAAHASAQADTTLPAVPDPVVPDACRGPPCGWIDPILDLRFPEKKPCATQLGVQPDPETCHALADGETLVLEGSVVWWWDVSQDGTYPLDPGADIVITFGPTERDPEWIPFALEPASFTLSNADLADPANYRQEEQEGSVIPRTVFWFERPVTLSLQRTGQADGPDAGIASQRGFESVFVKATSTESGERFRASFGIEEVRFLLTGPSNDAPAPLWPLLMLLPLAGWRRARQGR